jgi:iron complex transport system permease protein
MSANRNLPCLFLLALLFVLFAGSLAYGAVSIPLGRIPDILWGRETEQIAWQHIVRQVRLPQAVTALFAGASLATAGLLLQTLFRNPLAGPSILGVSDGANLGVALVMLYLGNSLKPLAGWTIGGYMAVVAAAFLGACLVLALIIYFASRVNHNVMLLIIGMMVGYLVSSLISILNYYAAADKLRSFVLWGLGNFSSVPPARLPCFVLFSAAGLCLALALVKPLNALLLGELYAANLGVRIKQARALILVCSGLLTAVTTAFCGPVSFIGLAVPHIARLLSGSSNHKKLLPLTLLAGSCTALLCNLLTIVPGTDVVLPLNAVTPILGAPVILYVILNRKNIRYND